MTATKTTTRSGAEVASSASAILVDRRGPIGFSTPKRRGTRLTLDIAVEVYGQSPDGTVFLEDTRTRVVSAHGALLSLTAQVSIGQMIFVVCKGNREEMRCRVVHQEFEKGEVYVGVAFEAAAPEFWGVSFPDEHGDRKRTNRQRQA